MKTVYIIAGNQREFKSFITEKIDSAKKFTVYPGQSHAIIDGVRYLYASDVNKLRGLSDVSVQFYGTSHERKDLAELEQEIHYINMRDPK
jgi:hypothetical protein